MQMHLKYLCNLARYWLQAPWGWHDSVEACRGNLERREPSQPSLLDPGKPRKTCVEMAGHRTFRILTYSQLSGSYSMICRKAPSGWHDSVETCSSVIICKIIVHLLVKVQNNKRCTVHVLTLTLLMWRMGWPLITPENGRWDLTRRLNG